MIEADRVALIGCIWFAAWIAAGDAVGRWLGDPGTGLVLGFFFGLASLPCWPWVLPQRIDDWIHDLPPAQPRRFWPWTWHKTGEAGSGDRDMKRVAVVAAVWFAFWMILAAIAGALMSKPGLQLEGAYGGFFNGAWWALLTSFAWPWFMPARIDRWMYG